MATEAAEEIIRAAFRDFAAGEDALTVVQRRATEIDALTLRIVSANEESWRRTCRLEREARAEAEADQKRYHHLRAREMAKIGTRPEDADVYDAGVDSSIAWETKF